MLETSALYKQILAGEHRFEHYLTVNGVSYAMSEIYGVKTSAHLYRDDAVNVGGCVSGELKCMIAPKAAMHWWRKSSIAYTWMDNGEPYTRYAEETYRLYKHMKVIEQWSEETLIVGCDGEDYIDATPEQVMTAVQQGYLYHYDPTEGVLKVTDMFLDGGEWMETYELYFFATEERYDDDFIAIEGLFISNESGAEGAHPTYGEADGYWWEYTGQAAVVIPSTARVCAFLRAVDGQRTSEWLPMGAWYIGTRDPKKSGKLELHCYDALRAKGEQLYTVSGTWTRTSVRAAAQRCATLMGVTLEDANAWSNSVYLDAPPVNYTVREVLSCCAAASCGNVSMCFSLSGGAIVEKLRLCPIVPVSSGYDLGTNRSGFVPGKPYAPYTHVIVNIDTSDGDTVSREAVSESDTGRTMEVTLFCVTDAEQAQAVADNLLEVLDGYSYQPFTAAKAWLDPALELGDGFAVSELPVALLGSNAAFGPLYTAEIEAPCEDEIESEVPSEDSAKRAIERKIAAGKASFDVKIDAIKAMVSGLAAPWEAGHSYSVGDIAEYESKFYRCIVANDDDEFDPDKWAEIDSGVVESILQLAIGKMTLSVSGDGSGSSIVLTSGSVRITSAATFFETNEAHFSGSLSANKISAGSIDADVVSVKDAFAVQMLVNNVWTTVGYVGAATGIDASGNTTRGAVLKSVDGDSYVIATNAGVRMQQGDTGLWIADDAISYRINGGDVTPLGYAVFS